MDLIIAVVIFIFLGLFVAMSVLSSSAEDILDMDETHSKPVKTD